MRSNRSAIAAILAVSALVFLFAVCAQAQAPHQNDDPAYTALKEVRFSDEAVRTDNVVFRREYATFNFRTGNIYFLAPINGKVTGAVFVGDGTMTLKPKLASEQHSLSLLSKSSDFVEHFEVLVMRFTDDSYQELKAMAPASSDKSQIDHAGKALGSDMEVMRNNRVARYNLNTRILQDLLATTPGGLFFAFVHGKTYSDKGLFIIDPQGVNPAGVQPEEVVYMTYDESKYGIWASMHLAREYSNGKAKGTQFNAPIDLQSQKVEVELNKTGALQANSTTTFTAVRDGIRVIPFTIFRNFRFESVTDEADKPLPFIFEEARFNEFGGDDDDNFAIILPKPLAAGEKFTVKLSYGGKEAFRNEGNGNYNMRGEARLHWIPYTRGGDYAEYQLKFRIPRDMKIAASGALVSQKNEGEWNISEWKSEAPIGVVAFNFGKFANKEQKLPDGTLVLSYANEIQPDWVTNLKHAVEGDLQRTAHQDYNGVGAAIGNLDTTTMMGKPLGEASTAIQIYNDYFGPISYKRISLTQQVACNYGQAWPGLVWIPICALFDSTQRGELGMNDGGEPYWNVVAAHEVAHEWWGHTVGWASYRDQWMSEGFAQLSASIFVQFVNKTDRDVYSRMWKVPQDGLSRKNAFGMRPGDVGPLTMGFRVNSTAAGGGNYRYLAYGRGAFVLHMIRMMMWSKTDGDKQFKEMMREFVKTYYNKPASTEDFKAMVEKHMTPDMDVDANGKMDWFFDEWVYGTEMPKYNFSYNVTNDGTGNVLNFKITQSGVSDTFRMLVPVYADFGNGKVTRLGSAFITGNNTVEQKVPVGKGTTPKRLLINYNYDVLSSN